MNKELEQAATEYVSKTKPKLFDFYNDYLIENLAGESFMEGALWERERIASVLKLIKPIGSYEDCSEYGQGVWDACEQFKIIYDEQYEAADE